MRPTKRAKVIIPTLQVLLPVAFAFLHHILEKYYINQPDIIVGYADIPIYVLLMLNYPLAVLWSLPLYPLYWAFSAFDLTRPSGAPLVAIAVVFDLAVLTSVAVFWYFVVVEIEKRKHGSSLIRFSSRTLETAKAIVLIGAGVGALVLACWEAHRLVPLDQQYRHVLYWSSMVNAIIGGLFLVIWAIVLIRISIRDLMVVFRKNETGDRPGLN